jgi:hypothetical protein
MWAPVGRDNLVIANINVVQGLEKGGFGVLLSIRRVLDSGTNFA